MSAPFFTLSQLGLTTSSGQLLQDWLQSMQDQFPGYNPSSGNLEYIQAQIFASWAADVAQQASSGAQTLFQTFGTQLVNLPFQQGVAAQAVVSLTTASSITIPSYVLPVGTQFNLDSLGFATLQNITITSGASASITISAVQTGSDFNGAGSAGLVQLLSQLDWVTSVTLVTAAAGGIDAEDDSHYLNRLAATLQLMAQRPITASDYATMALNFTPAGGTDQQEVGRATAVDGYDPGSQTFNNEREITVAVTDANGNALNIDTKTAIQSFFQSLREVNFIVNVIDPTYSAVYVTCSVHPITGWPSATVQANVQAALASYLSPANWGLPANNQSGWTNSTAVYRSQVEAVIQTAGGVAFMPSGTMALGLSANPTNTTTDLTLPGPVALPMASTNAIVVNIV